MDLRDHHGTKATRESLAQEGFEGDAQSPKTLVKEAFGSQPASLLSFTTKSRRTRSRAKSAIGFFVVFVFFVVPVR